MKSTHATPVLVSLAVLGCNQSLPTTERPLKGTATAKTQYSVLNRESNQGMLERLASYQYSDWTQNHVHIQGLNAMRASARARRQSSQVAAGRASGLEGTVTPGHRSEKYSLQALSPLYSSVSTSKVIGGAPAIDGFGKTYWLTADGDVYVNSRNSALGPQFSFNLASAAGRATDTFPETHITIYAANGYSVGYACSAEGYFYVIDFASKTANATTLGTPSTQWVNYIPAPFYDNAKTTATTNTVYVAGNGQLHRFIVNFQNKAVQSHGYFDLPARVNYMPPNSWSREVYYSSPIVFNDQLAIGSQLTPLTGGLMAGYFDFYDLSGHNWASTTAPTPLVSHSFYGPGILSSPSLDIDPDQNFKATWAFVPCGDVVRFFDLQGSNQVGVTPPLVVNPGDPNSGNPTGNVNYNFPYPDASIRNQVTIGSNWSAYVANTNAIWKIDYSSPTYGISMAHAGGANFAERAANVSNSSKTWYSRTHLGRSLGSVDAGEYVVNASQTTWDKDYRNIYVLDSFGNTLNGTNVSLTRFDTHPLSHTTAPTYEDGYDLSGGGQTTHIPGFGLASDWGATPFQILFSTSANLSTQQDVMNTGDKSSIWVFAK